MVGSRKLVHLGYIIFIFFIGGGFVSIVCTRLILKKISVSVCTCVEMYARNFLSYILFGLIN